MTPIENYEKRKKEIAKKLNGVVLTEGEETRLMWKIASELSISGTTVSNYLKGKIGCGYMAEAIYQVCKNYKLVK